MNKIFAGFGNIVINGGRERELKAFCKRERSSTKL
jgi:hypothetical protein